VEPRREVLNLSIRLASIHCFRFFCAKSDKHGREFETNDSSIGTTMGLHTGTGWNRWVKTAEAKALHAGRLNIGPRLILGFAVIIFLMLAADAVVLWQFHLVRSEAERLNGIDRKLVAVLRVHTSLSAFHDRLEALVDSQDMGRLVAEAGPLRTAVLEDTRRAMSALSLAPLDLQRDPTILPTLHAVQSALPSQLEAITTLATAGDWRAVRLRLANQVTPLKSLTSALVESVDHEVGEEQAQTVRNIKRVQRLVFLVVPLTAVFTLLIAATLGFAITRSITQPLARLVEGSRALARREFQHEVSVSGRDELAHLGRVFNETARRLQDLYATLQQSEDRLRLVIDTIPAHVWSTRPDGSVDFINRRWLETTGLTMRDALGWDWRPVVHPDDLVRYVDEWRAALSSGQPMESEVRLRRADGNYRWWLTRNVPLRDELGNIVKWYGTAFDIEDRHRAEDALRQSESFLHEAQRVSHTGSWRHDLLSGEMTISPEGLRIWGIEPDEHASVAEFFFGRMHPEDRPVVEKEYGVARLKKTDFQSDFRIVLPNGVIKNIQTIGHPILNELGNVVEFVGTAIDVTERKQAEEALRQAQTDLAHVNRVTTMGELTASLGHEINQPIAAAITNANTCLRWLTRDRPDVEEARAAAMRIVKDGTRAAEIIKKIRVLFTKDTSERHLMDVNETIREMIVLLRGEATRYNVSVRTELAGNLSPVVADRVQLQQVMMNLIMNSIDAMKDVDGTRELAIKSQRAENEQLLVSVSDTGVGLPAQQADQIFNAFFTTKRDGTGMGLRICRSIVESHGGRLWAGDNSPRGASFYFTLQANFEAHE
jgi:PAS domain S-box-containing protein